MNEEVKTKIQNCEEEIEAILKKHNCFFSVEFSKNSVLGEEVLQYRIMLKIKK